MQNLGMILASRSSTLAALLASSVVFSVGCAGSESATGGEPIDSSGGPVDDDDGGGTADSASTNPTNPTNPTDPTDSTNPTSADESGGCGGCFDEVGECQPGSFNEACGVLGDPCQACDGTTVCAEGACVEPPSCNPDNCDGCCDGDTCVAGNTPAACGQNGGQCNECPTNSSCDLGVCNLSCADSCDGCCDGDTCVDFDELSEDNCGVGGDACQPCGNGFECLDGECLSTACVATCGGCCDGDQCLEGSASNACGSDGVSCQECGLNTVCEESGCVPDPMALWNVRIVSGVLPLTDQDGDSWDAFSGLPDAYVEVDVIGMSGSTDSDSNTLFPVWNEAALEGVNTVQLQGDVEFTVWDSDTLFDQNMGTRTISIEDEMFGGGEWELTYTDPKTDYELWTITIEIESA